MSANIRSFVNFEDFPGEINEDKNWYEFPKLYKTTESGKIREWQVIIRCIKEDSKSALTKKQNWDLLLEDEVSVKAKYLENDFKMPSGILVQYWTETGIQGMKISRSAATYVVAKNVGKKNERNALQQALVDCRSKYLKKIDEGSTNIEALAKNIENITINQKTMFYPMLAKKYEDFINKFTYPVYVQPKLDGCRCIAFLDDNNEPTYKNVILYTRQQKDWPFNDSNNEIRKNLLNILVENYDNDLNQSIFLDGELYVHDLPLQEINSIARGKTNDLLEYHVYDMFYPNYDKESFAYRIKSLENIIKNNQLVKLVSTHYVQSREEDDKLYINYLEKKYEGTIVRTNDCPYLKSSTKKSEQLRSKNLLKRKETFDSEFEVVGYSQGTKGKNVGAIVWVLAAGDKTFNAVPNLSHEERYKIFEECEKKFDKKYKNRMMTVEYRGLSNDGIPLQAKAIEFRDYQ
jgi:ATP-dependent DNA ligase